MLRGLFGRAGKGGDSSSGWAVAVAGSGDVLLALPDGAARFRTAVVVIETDGSIAVCDARGGREARLSEPQALTSVSGCRSVILATRTKGVLFLAAAPVVRKGHKPQVSFSKGKVHRVVVERVVDDGASTGVWRGFVNLHEGVREVFAELTPPFPVSAGSQMRVVGLLETFSHGAGGAPRMRFRAGSWVPLADRALLFAEGGTARIESSAGEGGRLAWQSLESALSEIAALRHERKGTKIPLPLTRIRMNGAETAAQKNLRSRLERLNTGLFRSGSARGRRMRIPSTEWHGAVQGNGDVVVEVRRERFAENPDQVTVLVNREMVTTLDGRPSRIGVRCVFRDGTSTTMLLGGGPQELAAEIASRRSVVVVQGMPGAETYADVHVTIADVEKR